jgi:hypothetical protein
MEPSDQYLRSKRNLILFSGLLLLTATVGIKVTADGQSMPLIPFALSDVTYFDEVIVLLVAYFSFQLSLFWFAQTASVRQLMHYKIDFFASLTIAGISLLIYIYSIAAPLYETYLAPRLPDDLTVKIVLNVLGLLVGAISVLAAQTTMFQTVKRVMGRVRRNREQTEQNIIDVLVGSRWSLVFNPNPPGRRKEITFLENGKIGEGNNHNEDSWRVRSGFLEILNEQGKVFSRFSYDRGAGVFHHTNDEDTLSLRSQRIEPLR